MLLVCGAIEDSIGEDPNNKTERNDLIISPPTKSKVDPSTLLSFSGYNSHRVFITREGRLYACGNNSYHKISSTLPEYKYNEYTEIAISVGKKYYNPISVVCGHFYTIYLVIDPDEPNSNNKLIYSHCSNNLEEAYNVVVNIQDRNPIALYGGGFTAAAIDSEGAILFIPEDFKTDRKSVIKPIYLPDGEKAIKVACGHHHMVALSSTGHVYISPAVGIYVFHFMKFQDTEIVDISGCMYHFLVVTKNGEVVSFGKNDVGELGYGPYPLGPTEIVKASRIDDKKIVAAYAGFSYSLLQTSDGEILSCGNNRCGQLFIDYNPDMLSYFFPTKTVINSGARFCIAGNNTSFAFIDCDPPNCPNKKVSKTLERVIGPIKFDACKSPSSSCCLLI